ncbi:hypothetical protein MJT46_006033 [Ovis ammon polii x Ovis aries]|nr:hypothetical protein MJT46_006033 [Ovis ammon polii x Ovis aries]
MVNCAVEKEENPQKLLSDEDDCIDRISKSIFLGSTRKEISTKRGDGEHHVPDDFKVNMKLDAAPGEDLIKVLEDMRQEYEFITEKKHSDLTAWFKEQQRFVLVDENGNGIFHFICQSFYGQSKRAYGHSSVALFQLSEYFLNNDTLNLESDLSAEIQALRLQLYEESCSGGPYIINIHGVYDYAKPKRREKEESPTLTPSRVAGKRKGEKLSENLEPELPSKVGMKKQRWTAQVDEGNAGQQYRKRIKYPTYPRVTNELRLPTFFHLHHFQQTTGKQHIVKHQVSRRGLAVAYGRSNIPINTDTSKFDSPWPISCHSVSLICPLNKEFKGGNYDIEWDRKVSIKKDGLYIRWYIDDL